MCVRNVKIRLLLKFCKDYVIISTIFMATINIAKIFIYWQV